MTSDQQGRCGAFVTAAAKWDEDAWYINLIAGRTGDDARAFFGLNDKKKGIRVKQVSQFMRHARYFLIHQRGISIRNEYISTKYGQCDSVLHQVLSQGALIERQGRIEILCCDTEAGVIFK